MQSVHGGQDIAAGRRRKRDFGGVGLRGDGGKVHLHFPRTFCYAFARRPSLKVQFRTLEAPGIERERKFMQAQNCEMCGRKLSRWNRCWENPAVCGECHSRMPQPLRTAKPDSQTPRSGNPPTQIPPQIAVGVALASFALYKIGGGAYAWTFIIAAAIMLPFVLSGRRGTDQQTVQPATDPEKNLPETRAASSAPTPMRMQRYSDEIRWFHIAGAIVLPFFALPLGIVHLTRARWKTALVLIVVSIVSLSAIIAFLWARR